MEKFQKLNRLEMKNISGGVLPNPPTSCTADCYGKKKSVTCTGDSCVAVDGVGCSVSGFFGETKTC
jgi:hypothetical protein